jgi:uncharacterized protein
MGSVKQAMRPSRAVALLLWGGVLMVGAASGSEPEAPPAASASAPVETPEASAAAPATALEIAGVAVHPGEKREIRLSTSESFVGADVDMPLVVIRGAEDGPVLCLVAGIHGDELNGTEIVREILETHRAEDIRGTLIGIPIVNLFGFINQSRYLPDRRDLNRYFPGRERGSTASRIAYRVWTVLRHCTHLVDFHTGSLHRSNLPQIRGDLRRPEILDLARAFGSPVIVHNPGQAGTLRSAAVDHGTIALLYEAGETMRFQKDEIRKGVLGVRNVMVHLGMRDGRRVDLGSQTVYVDTRWVRAEHGGILELYPTLGEWVTEGDILGVISDPLRRDKGVLVSPHTGRIIGMVLAPMVIPGMAVIHVGLTDGSLEASGVGMEELDSDRPE